MKDVALREHSMKILVTGGSGTLGGYVLRELLNLGHTVTCYSRNPPVDLQSPFIAADIMDSEAAQKACVGQDVVVHLAAVPGPRRASPQQTIAVNLIGTLNILEGARKAGVRKVVFASSAAVLGFTFQKKTMVPRYFPIDEEHPCEPQDEYGLSKLLAEVACKSYSEAHGIQTTCLRINNNWYLDWEGARRAVQGGWARGMSVEELWTQRYFRTLYEAERDWPVPGPPSPRNNVWAVTDARDAAQAFRLAAEDTESLHEVFFINGADTCSLDETTALLSRHYPHVELKGCLEGHASLISCQKAARILKYRPVYSWRKSDFRDWVNSMVKVSGR
jgi:nucleoside-diphosphate-sugar epimerase